MENRRGWLLHLFFVSIFLGATTYTCLGVGNITVVCSKQERLALLKFKRSVEYDVGMLSSWVGDDRCRWERIHCDATNGNVQSLHLGGDLGYDFLHKRFFLVGNEVSSSLSELRHLKYLDLSQNVFDGSRIPHFIGSLKELTYLNLSHSGFHGIIPPHIGYLSNLQVLDLHSNYELIVDDMAWTSGLSSLKHLDLSFLHLLGAQHWSMVLYMIPSLKELKLSGCQLSVDLGSSLNSSRILPNIKHLDLGFNYFRGPLPGFFRNMTTLTFLDLSLFDLSLEGSFANLLSMIPSVSELHLSQCGLYHMHLSPSHLNVSTLPNIQHLDLGSNSIGGIFPSVLTNMSSLRVLDLSDNNLNSSVPIMRDLLELDLSFNHFKHIEHVGIWRQCHLKQLSVSFNGFDLEMVDSLKNESECSQYALEVLELYQCLSGTIPERLGRLANLRGLDLSSGSLTGPIPKSVTRLRFLEVVDLSHNVLTGPIPRFLGSFSNLDLSFNQLHGSIPESLGRLVSLQAISLSSNLLNGTIPVSVSQLAELHSLDISYNYLEGVVSEAHFANLSMLKHLDTSSNTELTFNVSPRWIPPFQLVSLQLSSCNIGNEFPQWLPSQRTLFKLTLSNVTISGPLPTWMRKMPYRFLDLSHNKLVGPLINLPDGGRFDVSGYGLYPELHLEDNLFNESIPKSLCRKKDLAILDLSRNRLTGRIPNCLQNLQKLVSIRFSSNKLSGVIPRSIGLYSSRLNGLKLNDNKFTGELPRELANLQSLFFLDLGGNNFFGNIPEWIGENLTMLMVLRLRSNNFTGRIPRSLCNMSALQILDVAYNNLTGTIPHCLGDLSAMVNSILDQGSIFSPEAIDEDVIQVMKGVDLDYTTNWPIVFNMDLSSNKFVGEIPVKLTALSMLMGLNLSNNHLTGGIPSGIGNMKKLESLDLSKNELTGTIPPSMAALNFLSHLNLSDNNLSGPIPTGNQLQTLIDPSIYDGNKDLCGPPLPKNCSNHEDPTTTPEKKYEATDEPMKVWFYLDIMSGFAIGFWGVIGVLLFKRKWRQKLFRLVEEIDDKIYVVVMIRVAKMKRGRETT